MRVSSDRSESDEARKQGTERGVLSTSNVCGYKLIDTKYENRSPLVADEARNITRR